MVQSILPQNQKKLIKVGDKVVGSLEGNRFTKHVKGSLHKLRRPPAWAIDAEVFDSVIKPNALDISVLDKEANIEYLVSVETFARHSFRFNRGFGEQYALPIQFWQTKDNGNRQLVLWGGRVDAQ
jgi:hypothetical protein